MDYRIKEEEEKRKNISNKIFSLKKDYISQASMVRAIFLREWKRELEKTIHLCVDDLGKRAKTQGYVIRLHFITRIQH